MTFAAYMPVIARNATQPMLRGVAMRPRSAEDAKAFGPWWYDYRPEPKRGVEEFDHYHIPMYRSWNMAPHEQAQTMRDMLQIFADFDVRARFHFGTEMWIARSGDATAYVPLVVYPQDGKRRVTAVGELH